MTALREGYFSAGLDADQSHVAIVDECVEDADRITAAADAGNHRMR